MGLCGLENWLVSFGKNLSLNVWVFECRCTCAVWQDTKKLWSIATDTKYRVAKTHRMP